MYFFGNAVKVAVETGVIPTSLLLWYSMLRSESGQLKRGDQKMATDIRHDAAQHRFLAVVDGHDCVIDYRLAGEVMTITHTGVPEAVGGRGIAADLMRTALETARANHWTVVPACSYAAAFLKRHPEFGDLLAA
jgi:uncharacterized protein